MANNAYVNKVVFGGRTLIDISDSSFDASKLPMGSVAYAASGERVVGSAIVYNVYRDTTANWNTRTSYVPQANDIIIYTDKDEIEKDGETVSVPGIKMGDGNAYVVDLPFVTDALQQTLMAHINDTDIHVTNSEKAFWSNKLNLDISDEMLIFTRQ